MGPDVSIASLSMLRGATRCYAMGPIPKGKERKDGKDSSTKPDAFMFCIHDARICYHTEPSPEVDFPVVCWPPSLCWPSCSPRNLASAGKLAIFFCHKKTSMIKRSSDISNLEIGIFFLLSHVSRISQPATHNPYARITRPSLHSTPSTAAAGPQRR